MDGGVDHQCGAPAHGRDRPHDRGEDRNHGQQPGNAGDLLQHTGDRQQYVGVVLDPPDDRTLQPTPEARWLFEAQAGGLIDGVDAGVDGSAVFLVDPVGCIRRRLQLTICRLEPAGCARRLRLIGVDRRQPTRFQGLLLGVHGRHVASVGSVRIGHLDVGGIHLRLLIVGLSRQGRHPGLQRFEGRRVSLERRRNGAPRVGGGVQMWGQVAIESLVIQVGLVALESTRINTSDIVGGCRGSDGEQ